MTLLATVHAHAVALVELWSAWNGLAPSQQPLGTPQYPYSGPRVADLLPPSGNALWYREPAANLTTWSTEWLPIGNGYLGAMVSGGTSDDVIQLNQETFWSGGPFANKSYNGGNRHELESVQLSDKLNDIRQRIFDSKNGETDNVAPLTYPGLNYGSYSGLGLLLVSRNTTASPSNYLRWLDLDSGFLRTTWTEGKISFDREYFCSYPTKSCTAYTKSSQPLGKNTLSYAFSPLKELSRVTTTCEDGATIKYRGQSDDAGMTFEVLAKVQTNPPHKVQCTTTVLGGRPHAVLTAGAGVMESWVTWVGETNYNIDAGDAAHDYSFKGPDPHPAVVDSLARASSLDYSSLAHVHAADYTAGLTSRFAIDLGQEPDFTRSTKEQVQEYSRERGNVHLEWVLFNYGRYMLFGSARGVLPSNLQGVWAKSKNPPWSADYHANINTQMNYWGAEITDMDVTDSLWDYMAKTWMPRGQQTAKILYNTTRGWVTHNEMNIFGHTGMKSSEPWNSAIWANYPAAAAWMMAQVIDHLDYGLGSIDWWQRQGWPLVKGTAEFWLDNLFVDTHTKDGTMVVNPCNSPEQAPITFGCAHFQQLVWELFNSVEKGFESSGDDDVAFLAEVRSKKARLDRGLHIGSWGQLQEWKVEKDRPTDLHRHLSHLIGLYPSYSIASYPEGGQVGGMTRKQLLAATRTSLHHRGEGKGPDADAGWEKVWRAACWAQLQDAENFYSVFKYAIFENFGFNLFSLYDPFSYDPIFQIDANLGVPGVLMNALLQAPDTSSTDSPLIIYILPAVPRPWSARGFVKGARLRGGIGITFSWKNGKPENVMLMFDRARVEARDVKIVFNDKVVDSFVGRPGLVRKVTI